MLRLLEVDAGNGPEPAERWWRRDGSPGSRFDTVDRRVARWALGLVPAPRPVPAEEAAALHGVAP
jgi:hypothetical protein